MASLHTFLRRQFSRFVRRAVRGGAGRGTAQRPTARLRMEWLESRDVFSVTNPIVAENQLPGNPQSEWDVVGDGDPTIQGFTTDISANHGSTVSFKVNDTASAPYHIDIYRLGYYQGNGARKVATIPSSQTVKKVQPSPLFDSTTNLVDAGNWSVTAAWAVPSTAVSGLYIGRLVREDTGGASQIFFVVRADDSHSDLQFQTSDSTWEAYNHWGGESVYQGSDGDFDDRARKVSYNRPLTLTGVQGGFGSYNSPMHGEYPMIRWLEANGYDVSYSTDVDSARYGSLIQNHRVFMSVGHDEYWSGPQRANVEAARDAGVNLAFFSGNEIYWKTRWEPSIDASATDYRTMVTYKESKDNARTDPMDLSSGVWTGTWRDARFSPPADGGRPENALSGTMYMNDRTSVDTGIAMQVPASMASLRFWRNTAVANLQPGQVATIGDRVVGYETDEDVDNGFRPAGLMDMSSTTFTTTSHVLDPAGVVTGPGTSTHSITLYRAASGALVFGAGTVQWQWGLDGTHLDGNSTPDQSMRQATVNLFADMGVQPGSLQAGLVPATKSTDVTRPTSTISSPAVGTTFQAGVPVTITGTATDSGGGVVAAVEVSTDGGKTWHPATGRNNWTYTWTPATTGPAAIISRASDDSGNVEIPLSNVSVSVYLAPTSTTGLVGAYAFNEGSGTTVGDSSSANNPGTLTNTTWVGGGVFGGSALSFNGTSSWATIPNSASLNPTTGFTLEAWVKPTTANGYGTVMFKERGTSGDTYSLYAVNGASAPPAAYVNTGTTNTEFMAQGTSQLPLNTWSYLTATYDGSVLSLYVNGNLATTLGVTGALNTSTGVLRIGGNSVYGDYFQGLIDEVRVYNRPLNLGEIRGDMSTPIGGAVETTPPTVTINTPTVSGTTVTVSATAADNVGVAGVQFLVNGQPVGAEVTAAPYTYLWNTAGVANGTYTVTARVRDVAGNVTTSSAASVLVNNAPETTPPSVSLVGLTANATIGGTVVLGAVASDNVGVAGVQFKANGVNIGSEVTAAPYQLAWNTAGVASGTYSITAVARDAAGNLTTSAAVQVVVDNSPPAITGQTPAGNATGVATSAQPTVTFSESILPTSLSFVLKDSGGNPLAATVTYDDATHTATLNPAAALTPSATYTLTVSGAQDLVGNVMSGSVSWSFTAAAVITGASIWDTSVVPSVPAAQNDSSPIEVGVKFRSALAGAITGLSFYKGTGNTGTHVVHLWTSSGTLLASATATNETATGWQTVYFATPVAISADTTYVASYYAPNGHYAFTSGFFTSGGVNAYPLRLLADGEDGGNGVFAYKTGGGFPDGTYQSANYWVDVVFSSSAQDTTPPTVTAQAPAPDATGVPVGSTVTVTFSEPVQAGTISFVLRDAAGNVVPASVGYNNSTWTATLTPTSTLASSAPYTVTVSGVKDTAGNALAAPVSWSFTTAVVMTGSGVWNTATAGSGSSGSSTVIPSVPAAQNDSSPIEVGVKFQSSTAGYVNGIWFYKGTGNTGTHVVHLWTRTGTLLAQATVTNETDTGWQFAAFSSPVPILADTTYVASYYAPNGHYAFTSGYFASAGDSGDYVTMLQSGVDGGNGVFAYKTGGGFPDGTYQSANYWVDVEFSLTAQDTTPPAVAAQTPAPGATAVPVTASVTATFTEPVQAASISFVLKDAAGNTVPGTLSYDSSTNTATLKPSNLLANSTTYTATVTATDTAGNTMAATSWSFATPTMVTGATLWGGSDTPSILNDPETNSMEVGVRFFSDVPGYITGLRFYKGPSATGTHVGHLWTDGGVLLATATFTSETASGWQQVNFDTPVAIAANTLYVASYYAPAGGYSSTPYYFASGVVNGYLHAPADGANGGNGLFGYFDGGGFPTGTYHSINYWVDVVFSQGAPDTTPPAVSAVAPAAGARGVLPSAAVAVTFSEPVQSNTIALVVKDSYGNVVTGTLRYDVATRTATFTPASPLIPFMTYTVTVSGAKDLSGNDLASAVSSSFTTRGVWTQTTVLDFSSGTSDGTIITNGSGGEIQLAPLLDEGFGGSTLNTTNWGTRPWTPDGGGPSAVLVSNGIGSISGTALLSALSYTNTAVEGLVSFGAAAYQHFGLVTSFDTASGNYWALFSTKNTTNHLFARVDENGTTTDVDLGALPTGFHTYRVQPTAAGFDFYIDNVLMTSIAAGFQASVPMKAGISDFTGTSGQPIQADWIRFRNYSTTRTGTFTSTVFDAGQAVTWDTTIFTTKTPANTTLTVSYQVGSRQADGSIAWTQWTAITDGARLVDQNGNSLQAQFLRYKVDMSTSDPTATPELDDITFYWV